MDAFTAPEFAACSPCAAKDIWRPTRAYQFDDGDLSAEEDLDARTATLGAGTRKGRRELAKPLTRRKETELEKYRRKKASAAGSGDYARENRLRLKIYIYEETRKYARKHKVPINQVRYYIAPQPFACAGLPPVFYHVPAPDL